MLHVSFIMAAVAITIGVSLANIQLATKRGIFGWKMFVLVNTSAAVDVLVFWGVYHYILNW